MTQARCSRDRARVAGCECCTALYALLSGAFSAHLPSDGQFQGMNENFSLIVMCLFLLGSLAFLAQQLTSYH